MLTDLHLLRPFWLIALLPLGFLAWILWRGQAGASASIWSKVVDPHLLPHLLVGAEAARSPLSLVLLGLGWLILVLALAGPVWRQLPQPVFGMTSQRVILLDLSPSMNAADVPPSRLARARFEILDLLKASKEGQVALIAFGPEPFIVSPLSGDAGTIATQIPQLATELIPVPGPRQTHLALDLAREMLERVHAGRGDLILVTDAVGDLASSLQSARSIAAAGYRLSVLGVGTLKGAPVPGSDGGFAQDSAGGIRLARLEPETLRELARAGNGRYLEASVGDSDTRALIQEAPGLGDTVQKTALVADQWREEGPWLLLALLPLAALAFRRGWLLPVLALALVLPADPSHALGWSDLWQRPDQQAARQLASGQAQAAAEHFESPAWRAAASYRAGDFQQALQALSGVDGPEADYNRGNALARLGQLKEASDAYEAALKQAPDHADARHNLELVRKLIEQGKSQKPPSAEQKGADGKDDGQPQQGQSGASDQKSGGEPGQGQDQGKPQGESGQQSDAASKSGAEQSSGQEAESKSGPDQSVDQKPKSTSDSDQSAGQDPASAAPQEKPSDPAAKTSGHAAAGDKAPGRPPDAGDFGQDALKGDASTSQTDQGAEEAGAGKAVPGDAGRESDQAEKSPAQAGVEQASLTPEAREQQQAMEAQLRRVPDEPAGLLRQRFLLQHLRREGRLP